MIVNLSSSQQVALSKIQSGDNVFITGPAGSGKSFLLEYIKSQYKDKNFYITASTGIAAVNVGGQTLHSWAGLGLGNMPIGEILKNIFSIPYKKIRKTMENAEILAIDEISMISANVFDLLNNVLKVVKSNNKPFGGIQLILFGDFLQLPPIEKIFCFESSAWQEANIKIVHLQEIFRQKDKDLINLLNDIRYGIISDFDLNLLKSRYKQKDDDENFEPTILGTHNVQVERINLKKLQTLDKIEQTFIATYEGDAKQIEFLKKNCIAQDQLVLKVGAQVMMLKNTYVKNEIINGSIGIVRDFDRKKNYPIVEFYNGEIIKIVPESWCIEKYNENTGKVEIQATMTQIPLILSWAITIHKSQGMTLDKIKCNLKHSFTEGQVYVGISRVRSLLGLFIESFDVNTVIANKKVIEFYKNN